MIMVVVMHDDYDDDDNDHVFDIDNYVGKDDRGDGVSDTDKKDNTDDFTFPQSSSSLVSQARPLVLLSSLYYQLPCTYMPSRIHKATRKPSQK